MDDTQFGTRDKRGHWRPFKPVSYAPLFRWPFQPRAVARWIVSHDGYMFPWNFFYAAIAVVYFLYLTPSMETMRTLSWDWPLFILLRNAATLAVVTGALHFVLYVRRRQGTNFKHNAKWPAENSSAFLFGNQNIDNLIWNFASGVPIWTAWEVGMLWAYANGYIAFVSFEEHPIYLGLLFFLVPLWKNALHFYFIHRLLHVPSLYHLVHKVHHANNNPGPWTGLSMHPVEHLLFYSSVLLYVIVPAHPVIVMFELMQASLGPGVGHAGFSKIVVNDKRSIETHDRLHYLHHKYFECNYGLGVIPLDKWFGTFHDGSEEADVVMNKRFMERSRAYEEKRARRAEKRNRTA